MYNILFFSFLDGPESIQPSSPLSPLSIHWKTSTFYHLPKPSGCIIIVWSLPNTRTKHTHTRTRTSTHAHPQLKNMVSALFQSRSPERGGTRDFQIGEVNFGWSVLEDLYSREMCRIQSGQCSRVPKLKKSHIVRESWTRLNVQRYGGKLEVIISTCLHVPPV